jgi:hypothetical protein
LRTQSRAQPARIADIAYPNNKAAIYDLLFKTMLMIAADPKHLDARIDITSVLHTWASAMTHHPHVHLIVPGGGISPDVARAGCPAGRGSSCRCACSRACSGACSWIPCRAPPSRAPELLR